MGSSSPVLVGTTRRGDCLIQILDRATMHHSPGTEALVSHTLERDPNVLVVIDLSQTTYLDSTFLGCLFGLYRRFVMRKEVPSGDGLPRLHLHASQAKLHELFGPLRLDRLIAANPAPAPPPTGKMVPLPESSPDPKTVCRHVMECHRRLAEMDTPAKVAFTKIADAMEQELREE